eukprot:2634398-Pyramimonas_sp.AAC.1
MPAHLSPNSPAPATGTNPLMATADGRTELAPRPQESTYGGGAHSYTLPALPPPMAPPLPTYSTRRLGGEQSRGPVRELVKFLIEWSHTVYSLWAAHTQ